jgi:hypothetical protein
MDRVSKREGINNGFFNKLLSFCIDAFPSREPESISLENAVGGPIGRDGE